MFLLKVDIELKHDQTFSSNLKHLNERFVLHD